MDSSELPPSVKPAEFMMVSVVRSSFFMQRQEVHFLL